MFVEIVEKCGREYMLRQMAEECNELAQAALKLIRVWHKETPMREDEAWEHLLEELADVEVMIDGVCNAMLDRAQRGIKAEIEERKMERMYDRLIAGNMDEDVW